MFCHKCGREQSDNSKFCTNCGEALRSAQPQPAAQQVVNEFPKTKTKPKKQGIPKGIIAAAAAVIVLVCAVGGWFLFFNDSSDGDDSVLDSYDKPSKPTSKPSDIVKPSGKDPQEPSPEYTDASA
ncbi:MAG: zinc ribbon domain-containing protein, partial [Oscillospiraceae bacterium]|nr:zinc ribbon domain-containing protein [Oscillospiraceae bacterium]